MKTLIAYTIRQETADDRAGIRTVVQAAFGRPAESNLVDGLRRSGSLVFSAVAVEDNRCVGYIAFSDVTVGESHRAIALATMAVTPDCQRQGIGSELVRWSLEKCGQLGHTVVLAVGDSAYYQRFGFTPAFQFNIQCPFVVPLEDFMVLELSPGAADGFWGPVHYPKEFNWV